MFTGVGTRFSRALERALVFRVLGLYMVAWWDVWGLGLLTSDLYLDIFGWFVGVLLSLTGAVNLTAVDISSRVDGALNGRFSRVFGSCLRKSGFSFRRAVRLTSHLVRARITACLTKKRKITYDEIWKLKMRPLVYRWNLNCMYAGKLWLFFI